MTDTSKPTRRDAVRNRARIVEVAREVLARRGVDTSMEDLAAEAGVGVGTLYRHFESKSGLIDAVFEQGIADHLETITRLSEHASAWTGLRNILEFIVQTHGSAPGTIQAVYGGAQSAPAILRTRVEPILTTLVERAKSEGALRSDFAATDVPIIAFAFGRLAAVSGFGPDLARRHLELYLKGIGPSADSEPVPPPLRDDDFAAWFLSSVPHLG